MKKQPYLIALIYAASVNMAIAQSYTPGNVWGITPNEFLGWDFTPTNLTPLNIKTELPWSINFYTGAGPGTMNNMRQTILGGYNGTGGLIGIGDMGTLAAPFIPRNLLHLHRNGNTDFYQ